MPQTLSEIRDLLASEGLRPQKKLGQNFLIDGNLMTKIVEAAEIEPDDIVLEIGAGTGSLTEMLLERARHVVAVELDRGLAELLADRLAGRGNLTLLHEDVLQTKSQIAPAVLDALRHAAGGRSALLVANLPYHIASPILIDLLLCDVPFKRFCFSVQREVADRIAAQPSTKDYGPISILLQLCGTVHRITHLPPQAFWPAPKVESTALRIDIDLTRFPDKALLRQFSDLLRLAFAHRRKTLNYNLKQQYDPAHFGPACAAAGIDPGIRAEALSPEQWYELFRRIPRAC
ncbi:MAG: 16S rRNA (adenine(1518)-N(6)/adenine(1519)-N(6))-dimethyltransferase RsmA [Planctomycetes bacterium]|nr:16S rRNA (adenine(1518)-N(6)/adenine(1519)-N(6))-dimethyltransferase RsmA [Planctomycetota bacterium]